MRQFFKKHPTLYAGRTGRQLRALKGTKTLAKDAFILADYLMACPAANQYGLYVLEPEIVPVHVPLSLVEFETAMAALEELEFACFDEPSRWVWVREMAAYQLGAPLKPQDNQVASVKRWYEAAPKNPFLGVFFDRYAIDLCLSRHTERGGPPVARRGDGGERVPPPPAAPADPPAAEFALAAPPATPVKVGKVQTWREVAFDRFWELYPKKKDHKRAFQMFAKVVKTPEAAETVLAGLERLLPDFDYSEGDRFIPAPDKWLERERWKDEPSHLPILSSRTQTTAKAVAAAARRGAPR